MVKEIRAPYIETEKNAIKLVDLLGIRFLTIDYFSDDPDAKGSLKGSMSYTGYEESGWEERRTNPLTPYEKISIHGSSEYILSEKKRLGLKDKGYKFGGMCIVLPKKPGDTIFDDDVIVIDSRHDKKRTIVFVAGVEDEKYVDDQLQKFKEAMNSLGF